MLSLKTPTSVDRARIDAILEEHKCSGQARWSTSVYGIRVPELSEAQFNALKRFVVLGFACTISLLSTIVSVVDLATTHRSKGDRHDHHSHRR